MDGEHGGTLRTCIALVLLMLPFAGACVPEPIRAGEVPGYYVRRYTHGVDELWLCEGGTWSQTYTREGQNDLRESGRWEFVRGDEDRIILQGYPRHWRSEDSHFPEDRGPLGPMGGYSSMLVERSDDTVRLILNVDLRMRYTRQRQVEARECL